MTRRASAASALLSVTTFLAAAILAVPRVESAQEVASSADTPVTEESGTYRIGSGDSLQLFVWKESELTREVTVRIDGRISVPLLGDVQAAGRTPADLADEIARQLKRFVEAPVVTVGVGQSRSRRFYVVGMVARPGEFPMSGPTTLVQALALAGGFRDFAKTDSILVLREGEEGKFVSANYKRLESARDGSQNILLQPGDTILVP